MPKSVTRVVDPETKRTEQVAHRTSERLASATDWLFLFTIRMVTLLHTTHLPIWHNEVPHAVHEEQRAIGALQAHVRLKPVVPHGKPP